MRETRSHRVFPVKEKNYAQTQVVEGAACRSGHGGFCRVSGCCPAKRIRRAFSSGSRHVADRFEWCICDCHTKKQPESASGVLTFRPAAPFLFQQSRKNTARRTSKEEL